MGFLDDVGKFFGDITGQNQAGQGRDTQSTAKNVLSSLAQTDASDFAQTAGQAGAQLGGQMGQQAAALGTQQAMQAARTAGLNKGQAALEGGQQAGQLFTRGQMQGQGLGMGAYGQGMQSKLAAAGGLGQLGLGMTGQGNAQLGNIMGGIGGLAGGIAAMEKGGVVTKPTPAVVGEKGPEAVLPLSDKDRTEAILRKIGLRKGAEEVKKMPDVCPHCGAPMKAKEEKKSE